MRALAENEKRTIRIATIFIVLYLAVFCGFRGWKYLGTKRAEYQRLVENAQLLAREIKPYEDKALIVQKLMKEFNLDPAKLTNLTVVAGASAAIQTAAMSGQVGFGPIRESSGQAASKELAAIQIEGTGQVQGVLGLLHRLTSLGYPVVIDTVQLTPEKNRPGNIKVNLTLIILDFEQWKKEEMPNA